MTECLERVDLPIRPSYVSAIDVKSVQIKIKNVKNVTKIRNVCKRNKKTLPLLSVVQLHSPRLMPNCLRGNSEYAIQFSFAETVVVLG